MRVRTSPTVLALSVVSWLVAGACAVVPAVPEQPSPESAAGPAVELWSPAAMSGMIGTSAAATSYFRVDRPGYATAFEVARDGRLRVLFPATPREIGRVLPGQSYALTAWRAQMSTAFAGGARTVPFTFVLVSADRPDLSRFGSGASWRYQVRLEGATHPMDVAERVAETLYPDEDREYGFDFAFVPPRVDVAGQQLLAQCGLRNADARNHAYFHDLWAVFDLSDPSLGVTPLGAIWASNAWAGWFPFSLRGGLTSLYLDRVQMASAAFQGGCWGTGLLAPHLALGRPLGWGRGGTLVAAGGVPTAQPTPPAVQPPSLRPGEFRPPVRPPFAQPIERPVAAGGTGSSVGTSAFAATGGERVLGRERLPREVGGATGGARATELSGLERGRGAGRFGDGRDALARNPLARDPLTRGPAARAAWRMEEMARPERRTREVFAPSARRDPFASGGIRAGDDPFGGPERAWPRGGRANGAASGVGTARGSGTESGRAASSGGAERGSGSPGAEGGRSGGGAREGGSGGPAVGSTRTGGGTPARPQQQ